MKRSLLLSLLFILSGCDIIQETQFKTDGSGVYSLEIDLSKMNADQSFGDSFKEIDTLIVFSKLI